MRKQSGGRGRIAISLACGAAVVVLVLLAISAGGSGSRTYTVRAIFDDAANIIPGEDVKIAGAKVGTVGSVTPTPQAKAAVVLKITNLGFKPFLRDASCMIRPEALIGEKYVDCLPTQPRVEGTPPPPPLPTIPPGHEGEGEALLPVTNTSSPVDVDLLGDISRLPERQRLTIIINELGAGLAGRGSDLNVVLRRANPALQELDKVLAILASENHVLAQLAVDSDTALRPLAAVRERVANYFVQSNTVAQATARHHAALARNLALFPRFLQQLGPSVERLGRFAEQTTPVATDLAVAAPAINKIFTELPAFSASSSVFYKSVGQNAKKSGPALVATEPLLARLQALGHAAKPTAVSAEELLSSLRSTGGLERLLDFIFLGAGASNGYDALGHFLRAEGVATICLTYALAPTPQCAHKIQSSGSPPSTASAASAANETKTGLVMARTLAVLKGATPAQALAKYPGSAPTAGELANPAAAGASSASAQPAGAAGAGTTSSTPAGEAGEAGGMLLNYLLGN